MRISTCTAPTNGLRCLKACVARISSFPKIRPNSSAPVVDPDLIELHSGVVVAAFGVRIPARANFAKPEHPWNGNYLAFSLDHGDTWPHVVRLTTGISTTHYMAIEETKTDNEIFVAYDFGHWTSKQGRYTYGRHVRVTVKPG